MRDRLRKWCENGLARITEDVEQLQMHKAIRNITRLFERIQDFEKRVVKRRGQLDRADAEAQIAALVLLARTLMPVRAPYGRGAAGRDRVVDDDAGSLEHGRRRRQDPRFRPRFRRLPEQASALDRDECTKTLDCYRNSVMNAPAGRSTGEGGGALGYGKPPWGGKGGPVLSQDLNRHDGSWSRRLGRRRPASLHFFTSQGYRGGRAS